MFAIEGKLKGSFMDFLKKPKEDSISIVTEVLQCFTVFTRKKQKSGKSECCQNIYLQNRLTLQLSGQIRNLALEISSQSVSEVSHMWVLWVSGAVPSAPTACHSSAPWIAIPGVQQRKRLQKAWEL